MGQRSIPGFITGGNASVEGDLALKQDDENRLFGLLFSCVATLLIMATCVFHYLPRDLAIIVVSWGMSSVAVGIWFGHGVLNEP
jgi:hypothetical protein